MYILHSPPLYKITTGKQIRYAYTDKELKEITDVLKGMTENILCKDIRAGRDES